MTELLKKAFERASLLPPKEQDAFAALVLAELEAEAKWEQVLTEGRDVLEGLANEARQDRIAGRTDPLDPKTL